MPIKRFLYEGLLTVLCPLLPREKKKSKKQTQYPNPKHTVFQSPHAKHLTRDLQVQKIVLQHSVGSEDLLGMGFTELEAPKFPSLTVRLEGADSQSGPPRRTAGECHDQGGVSRR